MLLLNITLYNYTPAGQRIVDVIGCFYFILKEDTNMFNFYRDDNDFMKTLKGIMLIQYRDRHYHNIQHVLSVASFSSMAGIQDKPAFILAAYFHDFICDPQKIDNEERSAIFAKEYLDIYKIKSDSVYNLIHATKANEPYDNDSAFFIDADMSILGSGENKYKEYASNIRKEYAHLSDDEYSAGRLAFLDNLLSRDIFNTKEFSVQFEKQAKKNIKWEIINVR